MKKAKQEKFLKIDSKTGRVTVEKINVVKRHTRPTAGNAGGIVEKELPLHYSNVLLHCPKCNRGVRHKSKLVEKSATKKTNAGDSKAIIRHVKIRVCKRCDESLDLA